MTQNENAKTIRSVETAFKIVEVLKAIESGGVSKIADEVGIPISTTYVHLNTLCHLGYVVKSANDYRLSLQFLEHGGAVRQQLECFSVIKNEINQVTYASGEIAGFATEEQGKRIILYRSEGSGAVGDRIPLGEHTYMHWTSLGKAILAYLPEWRVDEIIEHHGLPKATSTTLTERNELMAELESIQELGYAIDNAERRRGICGVAVPIQDVDEEIIGSVGIAGPKTRFDAAYMTELLNLLFKKQNIIEVRSGFYD